jgi:aryl-alcohol dehydrogenase-like predicted oxidoreductase
MPRPKAPIATASGSPPGLGVALVGMKRMAHVEENLATVTVAPSRPEDLHRLVRRHG